MNTQLHAIGKLSFNFTLDRNAIDPFKVNIYNEVSSYLLPVIEEVFDSSEFNNYDININKLTIDLGNIAIRDDSVKPCAYRLKQLLKEELGKLLNNSEIADCVVIPRKRTDEKILVQYLISGVLLKQRCGNPDNLLEEIIKNDVSMLVQFLIGNRSNNAMIRRLIWQFKIESIENIIIALNETDHEFIIQFVNKLKEHKKILNKDGEEKIISNDNTMYHRHILEFTLKYCLFERHVQFNRIDFVHNLLSEISNHYNIDILNYLNEVYYSVQSTALDSVYKNEMLCLLSEVYKRYRKSEIHIEHKNGSIQEETFGIFERHAQSFLRIIDAGTSKESCEKLWDLMTVESINKTIDFMLNNFNGKRYIRNFIALMDSERVNACIKLLARNNMEFIEDIITTTEIFFGSTTLKKQSVLVNHSFHKKYIHEFILAYLIGMKNDIFSELYFTNTILLNIANYHNISYTSLLVTMLEFLINEARCDELHGYTQLLAILQQLFKQHCKKKIPGNLIVNKNVSRQIHIINIYEYIERYLLDDSFESGETNYNKNESLYNDLKEIYTDRPDLIYTLFKKMKNKPECIRKIFVKNDLTTCKSIVEFFIHTLIDTHNQIQWNQSRNETFFKIKKQCEEVYLTGNINYYEKLLQILMSVDFSSTLNENNFFERIRVAFKNSGKEEVKNESRELNTNTTFKILSKETFIEYFYYFIEHPGNKEFKGISRGELLSYGLRYYKENIINEIIKILLERHDLYNVISESTFLFDIRIKECLSASPQFKKLSGFCKSNRKEITDDLDCNDDKNELLNFFCNDNSTKQPVKNDYQKTNIENAIKTLFSSLHVGYISPKQNSEEFRRLIEFLIVESPNRLRLWINDSCSNDFVIDNLTKIVNENLFLRLLLIFGSHTAMIVYSYYVIILKLIHEEFSEFYSEIEIFTLKKVILRLVSNSESISLTDNELKLLIGKEYLNSISHNNELFAKKIIEQAKVQFDEDKGSLIQVSEQKVERTDLNGSFERKEHLIHWNNSNNETLQKEKIAFDLEKEQILVTNAGIVLGAGYFERLFVMLRLTENKKFINDTTIKKAIKILHYFAANTTNFPEYELSLNKILCGVPLDYQIDPEVEITETEKEITDSLVDAIIENWPVMKNTKRESFRESFLNRRGYITKCDDNWELEIEKRSFDMLIDTLPWGFSMIKFPWMAQMVKVEWEWG